MQPPHRTQPFARRVSELLIDARGILAVVFALGVVLALPVRGSFGAELFASAAPHNAAVSSVQAPGSRERALQRSRAGHLTAEVRALTEALKSPHANTSRISRELGSLSRARTKSLTTLLARDPRSVRALVLPRSTRRALGRVHGASVETSVQLAGEYRVWHRDAFDHSGQDSYSDQIVTASGRAFNLYGAKSRVAIRLDFARLKPARRMSVRGYSIAGRILATSVSTTGGRELASAAGAAPTVGQVRVAVIVATFSDSTSPVDVDAIRATFEGNPGHDVVSYFSEASYGKMTLAPSFFGPFTLSTTSAVGCSSPPTQSLINAAASNVTFAQFSRLVFVYNCPNTGFGSATSVGSVSTPQGTVQAAQITLDARTASDRYAVTHELSHTLGGFNKHAAFDVCLPETFIPPTRFDAGCQAAEYGDEFDVLGSPPGHETPHLDPYHKANAGWFDAGQFPTVSAPGTYTYTLAPYERPTSGVLALNIPRGQSGTTFTVEYRQPSGFDAWMGSQSTCGQCTVTQGASIRLVAFARRFRRRFRHAAPRYDSGNDCVEGFHSRRGRAGRSAASRAAPSPTPSTASSIKAISVDSAGLTVQVTIPTQTCVRGTPTVSSPSPTAQTGTADAAE